MTDVRSGPAGPRRGPLIAVGLAMLIIGIGVAIGLWFVASDRVDRSAAALARAPVGCDTTLEFTDTGTFVLFIETRGRIDDLEGRCQVPARYERSSARLPEVTITVSDPAGRQLDLTTTTAATYDTGAFAGTAHREVEITETGRHVVRVESEASDVVIAVGRDPSTAGDALRFVGLLGGGFVSVVGGVLVVIGLVRRRDGSVNGATGGGTWAGAVTVPPPVAPPPPPPAPGEVSGPPLSSPPAGGLPPPSGPPLG